MERLERRDSKIESTVEVDCVSNLEEFNRIQEVHTSRGSVYRYLPDGKTQRIKIREGKSEEQTPQEILVYADFPNLDQTQLQEFLDYEKQGKSLYVIDSSGNIIRTMEQALAADRLLLALADPEKTKIFDAVRAQAFPAKGLSVYDQRSFFEGDQKKTERHIGNKVVKITLKKG